MPCAKLLIFRGLWVGLRCFWFTLWCRSVTPLHGLTFSPYPRVRQRPTLTEVTSQDFSIAGTTLQLAAGIRAFLSTSIRALRM